MRLYNQKLLDEASQPSLLPYQARIEGDDDSLPRGNDTLAVKVGALNATADNLIFTISKPPQGMYYVCKASWVRRMVESS